MIPIEKMKKIQIVSLALILVFVTAGFSLADGSVTLSSYLEQALEGNDTLLQARAEFRASTEKVRQAGVLPDPKLAVNYYLVPVETRTGPQNGSVSLSQSFPWFNKRSLLRELSDYDATIVGARLAAVELDVARQVKEAYIEYGFLGRSQQTVADNLELLRYLEGVARSRYAGGKATYFDVLKIQIELSKSEEQGHSLADQAGPLRININNLLGSESERSRAMPSTLPQVVLVRDEEEILSLGLTNAPLLHEAQQRVAQARKGKELAEKDFYPDFNVSLKTIFTGSAEFGSPSDSGRDPIIAGLTVNLPIFRDWRHGRVAEKEAVISSAQSSQQQQIRKLTIEIEKELYAYREAQRRIALYRDDLLPKVKQQLEVAINGFQSGQSSILELIDAEKNLLDFKLAEGRAVADRALAVARLESRTGMTLADWESEVSEMKNK
ncbi:MAG: TolC family protein [Proteobacteria bacterium]|nr:TolC family protein [Pseudomonadota bacterium]